MKPTSGGAVATAAAATIVASIHGHVVLFLLLASSSSFSVNAFAPPKRLLPSSQCTQQHNHCSSKITHNKNNINNKIASNSNSWTVLFDRLSSVDDDGDDALLPNSEQALEQLSLEGAGRIRDMGIAERTMRAMLAEQVEDDIFQMQTQLEELIPASPPPSSIPERVREECAEIAQQMKAKQEQYQALVTGAPSSILTCLESLGKSLE